MEALSSLLNAISSLLWPLIVLLIVVRSLPAIRSIIESARSRKFTLKVGGQELTMEEVNQQQRSLIADLQKQVIELRNLVQGAGNSEPAPQSEHANREQLAANSVLWVDDKPKNNSYFIQQLTDSGINVDLSLSTQDALRRLSRKSYQLIISDLGREEDGIFKQVAGLELLQSVRERDNDVPFVIYSSHRSVVEAKEAAHNLGVTHMTASPTALAAVLQDFMPVSTV